MCLHFAFHLRGRPAAQADESLKWIKPSPLTFFCVWIWSSSISHCLQTCPFEMNLVFWFVLIGLTCVAWLLMEISNVCLFANRSHFVIFFLLLTSDDLNWTRRLYVFQRTARLQQHYPKWLVSYWKRPLTLALITEYYSVLLRLKYIYIFHI